MFDQRIADAVAKLKAVRVRVVQEYDEAIAPHRDLFLSKITPFQDELEAIRKPLQDKMLAQFDVAQEEYNETLRAIVAEQQGVKAPATV